MIDWTHLDAALRAARAEGLSWEGAADRLGVNVRAARQRGIKLSILTVKARPPRRDLSDLTGQRLGSREVLRYAGASLWLCRCDCGDESTVEGGNLRAGKCRQCPACSSKMRRVFFPAQPHDGAPA